MRNPVKRHMDNLHKPSTHMDKKKESKKNPTDDVEYDKHVDVHHKILERMDSLYLENIFTSEKTLHTVDVLREEFSTIMGECALEGFLDDREFNYLSEYIEGGLKQNFLIVVYSEEDGYVLTLNRHLD